MKHMKIGDSRKVIGFSKKTAIPAILLRVKPRDPDSHFHYQNAYDQIDLRDDYIFYNIKEYLNITFFLPMVATWYTPYVVILKTNNIE